MNQIQFYRLGYSVFWKILQGKTSLLNNAVLFEFFNTWLFKAIEV